MKDEEKIKYFLYARKSSESEDRQIASIDSQIKELTKISEKLEIVDILSESQSAKAPGRPVFNKMINRIYNGEANGILCWKLDRLARNPVDGGNISWMLQRGQIKHIKSHDRSYLPSDNVLMMSVEFGMANQFILDLSINSKRGKRHKAEMGWYPAPATLGYKHDPLKIKGNKIIVKDLERFDLTRKMFDLMLTGKYNPQEILEIATNNWGLKNKLGGKIARSTAYRIFTDPFYYGEFEYPKNSGNWYQGKHEPMIAVEEYDRIQILLGRKGKPRPKKHQFAFTGMIKCGECGSIITAEEKIKRQKNGNVHYYTYYRCTKKKRPDCTQKALRKENLESQIVEILRNIEIPQEFHNWAIKWIKKENKIESESRNRILKNQQKAYNDCLKEIDGLISMRAKGELDEENYKRKIKYLTKEKARLNELLNDTDNRTSKQIKKFEETLSFTRDAKKAFEMGTLGEKKYILSGLGSNLFLKDKQLQISIKKPLFHMRKVACAVKTIHRGFEPLKNGKNEAKLGKMYSKNPILLQLVDDFRTLDWSKVFEFPELALENMKTLINS